jgi:hypothetical protein
MILIGSQKLQVEGVDVYPDHASPTQFWYLPGTVRLAERNKNKVLSYLWYTDSVSDQDGTGFLNFEVNTAVPSSTLDKIKSEIASKFPVKRDKITLAAVTYHAGNVNFSVLGPMAAKAAEGLATDPSVLYQSAEQLVWNAGSSSLVGDNAAVCSVKFTKEGKLAAAMKQAILSGSNTIAALYRLEFLAMRPSVTFKVTGTMKKTVEDFQASIGTSIPLEAFVLDLGIQGQWEKIMSKTDLKIEVTDFTGEPQDGLKWAQQILLDYILKNFFEVSIGPNKDNWSPLKEKPEVNDAVEKAKDVEQVAGDKVAEDGKTGDEAASAVKEVVKAATTFIPKVNIRASYYSGRQENSIDFLYSEMKAKSYPILPQALVLEGLGDDEKARAKYVTPVNRAQDPFGLPYNVTVALPEDADRAKVGLQTINVTARYPAGAPKDKQSTRTLTLNAGKVTGDNPIPFQFDKSGSPDVAYSVDYVFKPSDDWQSDSFKYSSEGKEDRALITAMPESVAEFLTLTVDISDDFVWETNDQVVVALKSSRWSDEKKVVFKNGDASPQMLKIRSNAKFKADPVQYRVEVRKGAKVAYGYGPEPVTDKHVTVRDRFADHVPVFFSAGFTDDSDSVDLTLSYKEGDFEWEDQFTLDKDQKGKTKVKRIIPTLKDFGDKRSALEVQCEVNPESGDSFKLKKPVKGGSTTTIPSKAPA